MSRWLGVCILLVGFISRVVKGANRLTAFQRGFQISACVSPTSHAWGEKILHLEPSKKKIQVTDNFLDGFFMGIKKRGSRSSFFFFNSIRGTPGRLLPDDEQRQPREPRELPLRIDVRLAHTDLPPPINSEPARPRRVYIRNSVELARYWRALGCISCEVAMTQKPHVTTRNSVGQQHSRHRSA